MKSRPLPTPLGLVLEFIDLNSDSFVLVQKWNGESYGVCTFSCWDKYVALKRTYNNIFLGILPNFSFVLYASSQFTGEHT